MAAPLVVSGLWKRFGRTLALRGVDLHIEEPGLYVLYGPNGSGKSTLIRIVLGLMRPSRGRVFLYGVEPYKKPRRASRLAASALEGAWIPPYLSGRSVAEALSAERGIPFRLVEEYAARLGVTEYWNRLTYTYSMGMRKRFLLALAFAAASRARMLVLDAPYTPLDKNSLEKTSALVAEYAGNMPVIVATHILTTAEQAAARIIMLESGRIRRIVDRSSSRAYRCPVELEEEARALARRHGGRIVVDYNSERLIVYGVPEPPGEGCEGILQLEEPGNDSSGA